MEVIFILGHSLHTTGLLCPTLLVGVKDSRLQTNFLISPFNAAEV